MNIFSKLVIYDGKKLPVAKEYSMKKANTKWFKLKKLMQQKFK